MNMLFRRYSAVLTLALLLLLGAAFPAASAQDAGEQEQLELFVGDIFEIIPVHNIPNPSYTWILTQDRTFIEAGRAQTFRKRLITPGRYTLYAEVSGAGQNVSRSFILEYKARTPGQQPTTATGADTMLVRTTPTPDAQGRIVMPDGRRLLRLDPLNPDFQPFIADLDLRTDSDGDGDPMNDIDTAQTFFQTDATPLHVWITHPFTSHPLSITVAQPGGGERQLLEVYSEAHAAEQGLTGNPSTVSIEEAGNRTFSFSAGPPSGIPPGTPLLYHWDFGDGQQSLLANPVHEYAADGAYEVMLRIRDLTNGREVAAYTEQITVEGSAAGAPVPGSDPTTEVPADTGGGSGIRIGSILLFGGVFVVSILFGLGLIILIPKLRAKGGSLSDSIEKMEQSIVKKDDDADDTGKTPTLSIAPPPPAPSSPAPAPRSEPPPEIAEREKAHEQPAPARQATPPVNVANAPSWLKSGLAGEPAPAKQSPKSDTPPAPKPQTPPAPRQPVPSPAAAPVQTPPVAPPPPAPAPQQPKPPTPSSPTPAPTPAPAPAPKVPAQQPPPQTPRPAPKPQTPPPAPAPQKPRSAQSTPAPEPTQQKTPDWLQAPKPQTAPATPKPQPPAAAPAPTPTQPSAPAPAPATPDSPSAQPPAVPNDQTVAFIRADSLDVPKQENHQNPPAQAS